ncbi:MAG: MarR family transcriptional regulator [Gemmatimonadota bacterium]
MPVERTSERHALAAKVWRQFVDLFTRTRGQREHVLQHYGLSPNDAKTLCAMDPREAKPMRALADLCCTDASNTTWVVDRLESRNLVERRSLEGDRRIKLVGLTTRGAKTRDAVLAAMHQPPQELIDLDPEDLAQLTRILAKIPLLAEVNAEPALPATRVRKPVKQRV